MPNLPNFHTAPAIYQVKVIWDDTTHEEGGCRLLDVIGWTSSPTVPGADWSAVFPVVLDKTYGCHIDDYIETVLPGGSNPRYKIIRRDF
ncbi:hypothetical protein [Micromonospora sp. NPDC005652]|uniref:hypothetical protein n=1 Tax=Micromonospora sp. NPDC005652 TaxID=3157046 RepID=UPI0034060258